MERWSFATQPTDQDRSRLLVLLRILYCITTRILLKAPSFYSTRIFFIPVGLFCQRSCAAIYSLSLANISIAKGYVFPRLLWKFVSFNPDNSRVEGAGYARRRVFRYTWSMRTARQHSRTGDIGSPLVTISDKVSI